MALKDKYASVIALGEQMSIRDGRVEEGADGVLRMWGRVSFGVQKDELWDAIHAAGGDNPSDIVADIQVDNPTIYATHTVVKGESLSKIAKRYYGDMMAYQKIFDANRDKLTSPDMIEVGQVLTIPNP